MKKNLRKIIIPAAIVLFILMWIIIYHNSTKIERNSSTAVGNTPGNLNSGGMFCESNGVIYFANPYDNYKLYSMKSDCTNVKNLTDDSVKCINSKGKYVYYIKNNSERASSDTLLRGELFGVVRCKTNGNQYETLYTGHCTDLSLAGNKLIFNATLNSEVGTFKVDIAGGDEKLIANMDVSNASVVDGHLYYSKPSTISDTDHAVYDMRISDGSSLIYCDANTYMANVVDNVLYYLDMDNNYALTAVDLSTNERKVLVDDKVVLYNVYKDVIYYQEESVTHSLNRINKDGSNKVEIVKGDVSMIGCTSKYTFYQMYGTDTLYRLETFGDVDVQKFYIEVK